MKLKLGVVMDPIMQITDIHTESTFVLLGEAQKRDYILYYMEQRDLFLRNGLPYAQARLIKITEDAQPPYVLSEIENLALTELDIILMRKDPPVDMPFIYATHILDLAEAKGVLVVNKPQSLRDANEKLCASWFPHYCPASLVSSKLNLLKNFLHQQKKIVIKKLDSMSSKGVFYLEEGDFNADMLLQLLTEQEQIPVLAQAFLPEVSKGDKRLFFINGELVPYMFVRIPPAHDFRVQLEAGATSARGQITDHERSIAREIGPVLKSKGLFFVSVDLIGDMISEINVTSVGLIPETDKLFGINLSAQLFDAVEKTLAKKP